LFITLAISNDRMNIVFLKTIFLLFIISVLCGCSPIKDEQFGVEFTGFTQGTTYSIYIAEKEIHISQEEIEQTLAEFDTIFSTYIKESHISKINETDSFYSFKDTQQLFQTCYRLSQQIHTQSNGVFDPSIYPLIEAWGFFDRQEIIPSQDTIDSLLSFVDFNTGVLHEFRFERDSVFFIKKKTGFKLDFNAIAQGFSVDVIARLIEKHEYYNYFIEIGGEIRVKGKNKDKKKWTIGIENPSSLPHEKETIATLSLSDCGLATSGNYRNFFEKEGKKYAHILHPKLGRPITTDIVSATVIAPSAALADAYATVFVILGKQKSVDFIKQHSEIDAVLIFFDEKEELQIYNSIEQ